MCIYYKGREGLTYETEDHIFSASIGGKKRLPKGYVSDQFNNDISKLEQVVFRDSVISIPRQFDGPGHRGRLGERHAVKSKVLLTIDDINKSIALGYMRKGEFTAIPFIELEVATGFIQFHLTTPTKEEALLAIADFKRQLQNSQKLKVKRTDDERLPTGKILFGIASDVEENFGGFIFKHGETTAEMTPAILLTLLDSHDFSERKLSNTTHQPNNVVQSVTLNSEHLRVYGKIAFNFFADRYGPDVPMANKFDPIRNWIAGEENTPHAEYILNGADPFPELTERMSKLDHCVVFYTTGRQMIARVVLYYLPVHVLIADNYTQVTHPFGMIVDWKNQKEIPLGEFMLAV